MNLSLISFDGNLLPCMQGLHLQDRIHGGMRVAHVREYSFLENARVPTEIKVGT